MDRATTLRVKGWLLALLITLPTAATAQTTFTNITSTIPADLQFRAWGASWVDYDGDGRLDLFLGRTGEDGQRVLRNTGSGFEFASGTGLERGTSMLGHTWGDYDNDGDLDVITVAAPSVLYQNQGSGTFSPVETGVMGEQSENAGWSAAWGDYDDDGFLDLVIANPIGFVGDHPNRLFHNEGDGTFTRVTEGPVVEGTDTYTIPSWADYDLDGDLDLVIGSGPADGTREPDNLYRNLLAESGTADFERITGLNIADDAHDGQVMNWIDYDNDGDFDLLVTNYFGRGDEPQDENPKGLSLPPALYQNNGDGTFDRITRGPLVGESTGQDLANTWGDVDNDGDLDVLIVTGRIVGDSGEERLYFNNGDGTFTRATEGELATAQTTSSGASFGDYDEDGDLDLVVTGVSPNTPQNRIFRNDLANGNGWIQLRLVGTASNRSAIGAIVKATAILGGETVTQMRQVSAQDTFGGQNSLTVHFGLGDAERIEELVILWPSGAEETVEHVAPNQIVTVTEGEPFGGVVVGVEDGEVVPEGYRLEANYPNPFNPSTVIRYALPRREHVTLTVYDAMGRAVAVLAEGLRAAGAHEVSFEAAHLASGIYLYRLETATFTASRRMLLAR